MSLILIVDDEEDIVELLKFNLTNSGHQTLEAHDGKKALELIESKNPDLILLDWMLPEVDGIEVCKKIKTNDKTSNIPIIMISAKSDEFDKVLALEIGADDYVSKPFSIRELLARIKAILRRAKAKEELEIKTDVLEFDKLKIDKNTYEIYFEDSKLNLTKTEYDLIYTLASTPDRVLTREQLLYKVWGNDFFGDDRVVDVHIRRLRSKLEEVTNKEYVQTVRGVGYKFIR